VLHTKDIEEQTKTWDKIIVDRRKDLVSWVDYSGKLSPEPQDFCLCQPSLRRQRASNGEPLLGIVGEEEIESSSLSACIQTRFSGLGDILVPRKPGTDQDSWIWGSEEIATPGNPLPNMRNE